MSDHWWGAIKCPKCSETSFSGVWPEDATIWKCHYCGYQETRKNAVFEKNIKEPVNIDKEKSLFIENQKKLTREIVNTLSPVHIELTHRSSPGMAGEAWNTHVHGFDKINIPINELTKDHLASYDFYNIGLWTEGTLQTFKYHGRDEYEGYRYTVPHEVAHVTVHYNPKRDKFHHKEEEKYGRKRKEGHTNMWYNEYQDHLKVVESQFFDEIEKRFKGYRLIKEKEKGKIWYIIK